MIWKWFDCKLKCKNLQQIRLIMWTINVLAKKIKKSVLRLVTNLSYINHYIYLSYIKYYIKNLQINLADGKRKEKEITSLNLSIILLTISLKCK